MGNCLCEDWDIKFVANENLRIECGGTVSTDKFVVTPSWDTFTEDLWHLVTVDTGEVGTLRRTGNRLEFCFPDTLIIQKGACLYITLVDEIVCGSEELPAPETVKYEYTYNHKRVDPCE